MLTLTEALSLTRWTAEDETEASALPVAELRETIFTCIYPIKGNKSRLREMRKPQLVRLAAKLATYMRDLVTLREKRRAPRPRKPVRTRAERLALGSRTQRRMYTKSRNARSLSRIS